MKKSMMMVLAFLAIIPAVFSTNVILKTDKKETTLDENTTKVSVLVNETIYFKLIVTGGGFASGGLVISRETDPNQYKMIGVPHFSNMCTLCRGATELGDLNEELHFTPDRPGNYLAEADYSTVVRKVYVNAYLPSTTTTTSTTSTSTTKRMATTTSTTTSSTTSSTTTTTSTTTTKIDPVTTTVPAANPGKTSLTILYIIGLILVLFILFAANRTYKK